MSIKPQKLSEKELKDQDLISTHKLVVENYLIYNTNYDISKRNFVMKYYDKIINRKNIRLVYNRNIKLFLVALLTNRLDNIIDNFYSGTTLYKNEDLRLERNRA